MKKKSVEELKAIAKDLRKKVVTMIALFSTRHSVHWDFSLKKFCTLCARKVHRCKVTPICIARALIFPPVH